MCLLSESYRIELLYLDDKTRNRKSKLTRLDPVSINSTGATVYQSRLDIVAKW